MDPFVKYLTKGVLPSDPKEARLLKWIFSQFELLDEYLYRKSFSFLLLKCLRPSKADYVLQEICEGICMNHLRGMSLVYNLLRQRDY